MNAAYILVPLYVFVYIVWNALGHSFVKVSRLKPNVFELFV